LAEPLHPFSGDAPALLSADGGSWEPTKTDGNISSSQETTPAVTTNNEEERMCRYCFEGEEGGELISPCRCAGGQKWVHLICLRAWQRTVLVSQPTHPDLYDADTRQRICNVCKAEFTCPPPTRAELLASFTGPELVVLIDEGRMIASAEDFSWELEQQVSSYPEAMWDGLVYRNWVRGVFWIVKVVEDRERESVLLRVNDDEDLARFSQHLGEDGESFHLRGRRFSLLLQGPLRDVRETATPEERREVVRALSAPLTFRLRPEPASDCGEDGIVAVNLTRPFDLTNSRGPLDSNRRSVFCDALRQVGHSSEDFPAQITHFIAGPCEDEQVAACFVIANGEFTIMRDSDCLPTALRAVQALTHRASTIDTDVAEDVDGETEECQGHTRPPLRSEAFTAATEADLVTALEVEDSSLDDAAASHGTVETTGQSPHIAARKRRRLDSPPEAVAGSGGGEGSDGGNRERNSDAALAVGGHEDEEPVRLCIFWGYAGWSRCQLMGEIARGSWGLCKGEIGDVVTTGTAEVWRSVYPRLIFAPKSEMSETYRGQARQEEEHRRELRRMAIFHDLLRGRPGRRARENAARQAAAQIAGGGGDDNVAYGDGDRDQLAELLAAVAPGEDVEVDGDGSSAQQDGEVDDTHELVDDENDTDGQNYEEDDYGHGAYALQ